MKWTHESVLRLIDENGGENPVEIIKDKARALVLKAFDMGWEGPPFDPIQLAKLFEIEIAPNEGVNDARILPVKKSFKIEYNPFQRETRVNFSIAHEIAHTLFSDCNMQIRNRENDRTSEWELELLCNIAAAELLLPYAEFSNEANSMSLNMDSLLQIAAKYKASLESVFLRFCDVAERPCAIILADFDTEKKQRLYVRYSKASRPLAEVFFIDQGVLIPKASSAYECLNSGWTSRGLETWPGSGETRFSVSSIGLPAIKGQKNSRVGLFIVPEHYHDAPDGMLNVVSGDATQPRGSGRKIIAQIVNTSVAVGFGFGRAISKKWPVAKNQLIAWKATKDFKLGNTQTLSVEKDISIVQIIAQEGIKPGSYETTLRYEALQKGLKNLYHEAVGLDASVHMPKIGAGQARGDWNRIEGMIHTELVAKGVDVTVYVLPGSKKDSPKANLTLFSET